MNSIRRIKELNLKELENGVPPEASWHADYRDTAYIYIGGLPLELSEGDVITIFSQYGEPTYVNLVRDRETGKSRGFAFLKYEDQRSTDLAVDNLGGSVVLGRKLNVDHTRYKRKDEEPEQDLQSNVKSTQSYYRDEKDLEYSLHQSRDTEQQPIIKEEQELAKLLRDTDGEDPMKSYFIQEKKEQIALALSKSKNSKNIEKSRSHRIHHHGSRSKKSEGRTFRDEGNDRKYDERRKRHAITKK